jgi:hypothetical protein
MLGYAEGEGGGEGEEERRGEQRVEGGGWRVERVERVKGAGCRVQGGGWRVEGGEGGGWRVEGGEGGGREGNSLTLPRQHKVAHIIT